MSSTQQAVRKVLLLIAYYRRGNRREEMKWLAQSHTDRTRSAHRTGHRVRSAKVFIPNTANPLTFLFFRGILALLLFHLCFKISFQFSWKKKSHWDELELHWICSSVRREWHLSGIEFPIREHMLSLHLFRSYSMPFNKVLQLLTIGFIRVFLG